MKYLFIANPVAGKGKTKKLLAEIEKFLNENKIDYKLIETSKAGDVEKLTQSLADEYNRIIAIGGDGTVHELLNVKKIEAKTIGVLPTGSGNDFAATLGLKKGLIKDLKTILMQKTLNVDIGFAEIDDFSGKKFSFLFANSLGIGFDAEVAASVIKIKFIRGLFLYLLGVFLTLIKYKFRKFRIKTEDFELNEPLFMISIGNGKTAGGGFKLTPLANPIDGFLDICMVKKISKFKVLSILPLAIFGKHIKNKSILYFKIKNIEISSDKPVYIHADGEIKSKHAKNIKITVLKRFANFITDGVPYVNEKT